MNLTENKNSHIKKIGITTTVPLEVILAAQCQAVDLINVFVSRENHQELVDRAERYGFPKSQCACIKGSYGSCLDSGLKKIVGVVEGDCSNSKALLEVLEDRGIEVVPFGYPHGRKREDIKREIDNLMSHFDVTMENVESIRRALKPVRALVREIDEETYITGRATGFENHLYQVMNSDLDGMSIEGFKGFLEEKLREIRSRDCDEKPVRLGFIGVPPVTTEIFDFVETLDAKIIYNEVQREFAFPRTEEDRDIYDQYLNYTYPYDIYFRLEKIKEQIKLRKLDAIIHYTQAFCYRGIEDIIVKKEIGIPVLTVEGDKSKELDGRMKLRFEAFIDMILDRKKFGEIR